ncbi:uncharacterized protein LOC132043234 [Lycium ferocissimum]|uniref:uncharacterized protein LOC132043234 n=1 Tax=Lycium ferocissimum TaxID=112874 RepID=UPI0028164287|nr:uncharacterized protein LOC132043234 [Lycium ferocissimum]
MKLSPHLDCMLANQMRFLCLFLGFLGVTPQKWSDLLKVVHPYIIPTMREMEQDYMKDFLAFDDEVDDPTIDKLKTELEGVTILVTSQNGSKAPSRLRKEPKENSDEDAHHALKRSSRFEKESKEPSYDVKDIQSEDFGGNVGIGTSRGRAAPRGGPSMPIEHVKL